MRHLIVVNSNKNPRVITRGLAYRLKPVAYRYII